MAKAPVVVLSEQTTTSKKRTSTPEKRSSEPENSHMKIPGGKDEILAGGKDLGKSLLNTSTAVVMTLVLWLLMLMAPCGIDFSSSQSSWGLHAKLVFLVLAVALEITSPSAYFLVSLAAPPLMFAQCLIGGNFPSLMQWLLLWPRITFLIAVNMSMCLHRYFSHKAFETSRVTSFMLGILSCLAYQGGPLWWAAKHVRHHRHCDLTSDPHSVKQLGFWYAFLGWGFNPKSYSQQDYQYLQSDFLTPELHFVQLFNNVPSVILCQWATHAYGYPNMVFSFLLPMLFCRIITFLFNVEFHPEHEQPDRDCQAANIPRYLAVLVGEWEHATHHVKPYLSRRGDWDLGWWATLSWMKPLGIVWNCR